MRGFPSSLTQIRKVSNRSIGHAEFDISRFQFSDILLCSFGALASNHPVEVTFIGFNNARNRIAYGSKRATSRSGSNRDELTTCIARASTSDAFLLLTSSQRQQTDCQDDNRTVGQTRKPFTSLRHLRHPF